MSSFTLKFKLFKFLYFCLQFYLNTPEIWHLKKKLVLWCSFQKRYLSWKYTGCLTSGDFSASTLNSWQTYTNTWVPNLRSIFSNFVWFIRELSGGWVSNTRVPVKTMWNTFSVCLSHSAESATEALSLLHSIVFHIILRVKTAHLYLFKQIM